MKLEPRDTQILLALALKVRLLSLAQIAEVWWNPTDTGRTVARRRLVKLSDSGFLKRLRIHARPLPELTTAVLAWDPGQPAPNHGAVAWQLQSRWSAAGPKLTTVYIATRKTANLYGGRLRGTIKHTFQVTHDLGVAQMYLRLLETDSEAAADWQGEDLISPLRRRQKIPDAVLAETPGQRPRLVLEFGGAYDIHRVRGFHKDCAAKSLPYQIW